jgi:hypothetical protein
MAKRAASMPSIEVPLFKPMTFRVVGGRNLFTDSPAVNLIK